MKTAIFGGDKRMLFAAKAFAQDGHEVYAAGFDHLESLCEIQICTAEEAAGRCDLAVLPVRPVSNGEYLNAPFSGEKILIKELMEQIGDKPVFTGAGRQIGPYAVGKLYDYAVEESFVLRNAELTAEGAIGILLNEYERAICGCPVLVTGYGRIGSVLSGYLKALGADVTVAARKPESRAAAEKSGLHAEDYPQIDYAEYHVVINTVPAFVLDKSAVDRMREDVFIIDLASVPGGVDFQRAKERELTCIHALSLPGKTAPLTAGTIIKDTVMNILSREQYK